MSYIKVNGHENLYRDPQTGAIVNTDIPPKKSLSKQFNTAIEDINNLKDEVFEIKSLLKQLIKNANH